MITRVTQAQRIAAVQLHRAAVLKLDALIDREFPELTPEQREVLKRYPNDPYVSGVHSAFYEERESA